MSSRMSECSSFHLLLFELNYAFTCAQPVSYCYIWDQKWCENELK